MRIEAWLERIARFFTPVSATPSLDVAANREHLRSGDPERMREGLGFLAAMGPRAQAARPDVVALLGHHEPTIAALAARALRAIERG